MTPEDIVERGIAQYFYHAMLYLPIAMLAGFLVVGLIRLALERFDRWYSSRPPRKEELEP